MQDDEKPALSPDRSSRRSKDPVEEAAAQSFPASDPPAWTAARAGKPRLPGEVRGGAETKPPLHCEAIGLFRGEAAAQAAADALLASGFNRVDIGPPRLPGDLGAGLGAKIPPTTLRAVGFSALLGALMAGTAAALVAPRGVRHVVAAAAGGAVGALSAHTATLFAGRSVPGDWPKSATLLRVRLKTPADQKRALEIIEGQGAVRADLNWSQAC